jgi:hypothetical protein
VGDHADGVRHLRVVRDPMPALSGRPGASGRCAALELAAYGSVGHVARRAGRRAPTGPRAARLGAALRTRAPSPSTCADASPASGPSCAAKRSTSSMPRAPSRRELRAWMLADRPGRDGRVPRLLPLAHSIGVEAAVGSLSRPEEVQVAAAATPRVGVAPGSVVRSRRFQRDPAP